MTNSFDTTIISKVGKETEVTVSYSIDNDGENLNILSILRERDNENILMQLSVNELEEVRHEALDDFNEGEEEETAEQDDYDSDEPVDGELNK